MSYTLIIIILTAVISISAFNNTEVYNRLILWPKRMKEPAEYHRLLSSGFIHADWMHLGFNMLTLYFFGNNVVEPIFAGMGRHGIFLALYLIGIVASSLPSFVKHKDNGYYRSLGASGGVSAVLFSSVYFSPWTGIMFFPIPIEIPAIVFAGLYLVYCVYMSKKGSDNINHDAHFWGAVFGLVFTFLFDPTHGQIFLQQITHPSL